MSHQSPHSQSPSDSPERRLSLSTESSQTDRRAFVRQTLSSLSLIRLAAAGGVTALATTVGCQGDTSYDAAYEPYWIYRASRLEEYQRANFDGVRTRESPGDHNVAVHLPIVTVQDSVVIAKVDHVMETEHWVTTVYFQDTETGRVFYLQEFMPLEKDPGAEKGVTVQAPLPDEVQQFAVFAYCNKHELWMSDIISFA